VSWITILTFTSIRTSNFPQPELKHSVFLYFRFPVQKAEILILGSITAIYFYAHLFPIKLPSLFVQKPVRGLNPISNLLICYKNSLDHNEVTVTGMFFICSLSRLFAISRITKKTLLGVSTKGCSKSKYPTKEYVHSSSTEYRIKS
jgi:hypothetical protein